MAAPSVPHVWPREQLIGVLLKFSDGLYHPEVAIMDYAGIKTCPNYSLLHMSKEPQPAVEILISDESDGKGYNLIVAINANCYQDHALVFPSYKHLVH